MMKISLLLTVIYLMKISNAIWPLTCENNLNGVYERIDDVAQELVELANGMAGYGNILTLHREGIDHLQGRLDVQQNRLGGHDNQLHALEDRAADHDNYLSSFQHRLDLHMEGLDAHGNRLHGLEDREAVHDHSLFEVRGKANDNTQSIFDLTTKVNQLKDRLEKIDSGLDQTHVFVLSLINRIGVFLAAVENPKQQQQQQ
jgi:chromosome segregation ATPase